MIEVVGGPSPTRDEPRDVSCSPSGMPSRRGSPRGVHTRCSMKSRKSSAAQPLDEIGEHPVRGRGVVLEARARLPLELPLREPFPPAAPGSAPSADGIAAFGKPAVCSITCSTVIASFPLDRELGHVLGDRALHVEQPVSDQAATSPTPRSASCTRRCSSGCRWSRRRTSRTRRARRHARPRTGTTAASRSRRRRARVSSSSRRSLTRRE